jgi:hypothetical protein
MADKTLPDGAREAADPDRPAAPGWVLVPRDPLMLVLNAIAYNQRVAETLSHPARAAADQLARIAKQSAEAGT